MRDWIDTARICEDEDYRQELRHRMQTDLFFLAKYVLGYDKMTEQWHRPAAEVFIRKDPSKSIGQQSRIRHRMLLLPRKTFKTSLNICDTVQWILCFPEIAIMVMTASNSSDSPLADAFVAECASHFVCGEGDPRSALHLCFPEFTMKKMPKAGEFYIPCRGKFRRDPTVKGVSIEQSLSGWHPDIIKSEDVQDNRNSQTGYALKKVRKNFYLNLKMLGEHGYVDITGTRYGPMDLYGDMIAKAGEETLVYWKPAYIRKPHALKLDDEELGESDVILQFPEQLSWSFLRDEKHLDPETFWTQYMNVAEGNFIPTFPIERLQAATIRNDAAQHGKVHIAWRFEYAESKHAACAVGIEREGRITIVEVMHGQFTPTALARRVVDMAKKWETRRVMIEETPGANSIVQHIHNEALEMSWRIEIQWIAFLKDQTARMLAIKSAEPHLLAGRLLFADGIPHMQETFRQLYQLGMIEETEIAAVVSHVAAQLPQSIAAHDFDPFDEEAFAAFIERDAYDRVYSRGAYSEPEPPSDFEEEDLTAQNEDNDYMPGLTG
jgi:hypothetical protein